MDRSGTTDSHAVPPFADIVRRGSPTPESLSGVIYSPPHPGPNLDLPRGEIEDLAAYRLSLR